MKVVNLNVSAYVPGTELRIGAFCDCFPDEPLVILSEGGGVHIWRGYESYFISFVRVGEQKKFGTPRWVEDAFGEWVRGLDKGRVSGESPGGGDLLECCGTDVGPVPGRLKPVDDADDAECLAVRELAAVCEKFLSDRAALACTVEKLTLWAPSDVGRVPGQQPGGGDPHSHKDEQD